MSYTADMLDVLKWAQKAAKENEVVKQFWEKYCDAVNEKTDVTPERAFKELRFYGSNTLLRPFRDEPVPYAEVAYDVASTLKPAFRENDQFREGDVLSCESYVLKKMSISQDDIKAICDAIDSQGMSEAVGNAAKFAAAAAAAEGVGYAAAKEAAKYAAQEAAKEAVKRVAAESGKAAAAEAAKAAAKKAAQKAAQQAAQEAAKQVVQRVIGGLNIALAALTVISIAGPASRVTIPAVTYAALLRKMHARAVKGI